MSNARDLAAVRPGKGAGSVATNTAVGASALAANSTGAGITAVGYLAGTSTTASNNAFIGSYAGRFNTSGINNVAVGSDNASGDPTLYNNTTGSYNTALGVSALAKNTIGSRNTAVGYQAGYNHTYYDATFIGYLSGYSNTSGAENTSVGHTALYANTSGSNNTAMGKEALYSNTTGIKNTSVGNLALYSNTTASNNTAVGYQAGYNVNGSNYSVFVGSRTASSGAAVVTGNYHTCVGDAAGFALQGTSANNALFGQNCGSAITTGSKNTVIGSYTGNQGGLNITTASNYIVLSDGDGNPRGIFDSNGRYLVGGVTFNPADNNVAGAQLSNVGSVQASVSGATSLIVNRKDSDGTLTAFLQDGTTEGTISVSGTTVSYNGGHLARYAQTLGAKDESLVKGTVLSNLNEMNVYTDSQGTAVANEQLNKVKVSDVEGDINVAGVFVNWSFDEQHSVDEINMAMTGDMIIRIAQGVMVQRGDLLMSAGDGTAKPQGDDIIRSKTVAKVTSTHITCTYEDGSYCVPCVLMAC